MIFVDKLGNCEYLILDLPGALRVAAALGTLNSPEAGEQKGLLPDGAAISQPVEVYTEKGKLVYSTDVESARAIILAGDGRWKGRNKVILWPDQSKRGIWQIKQSGQFGPLVMQLT